MCIYTHTLESKILKKFKNSSRKVRDSTERPKIRCLLRKGYCKNLQKFRHVMLHTGR